MSFVLLHWIPALVFADGAAQGTEESQEFGSNYRFVGLHSGEGGNHIGVREGGRAGSLGISALHRRCKKRR